MIVREKIIATWIVFMWIGYFFRIFWIIMFSYIRCGYSSPRWITPLSILFSFILKMIWFWFGLFISNQNWRSFFHPNDISSIISVINVISIRMYSNCFDLYFLFMRMKRILRDTSHYFLDLLKPLRLPYTIKTTNQV